MKKRFLKILATAMLISLFMVQGVYATGGLTVESVYPADGEKGIQTTNQMARIVFSGDIDVVANQDYFKILDSEGKKQGIMVLEQSDNPNRVNLVLEKDLKDSAKYTIVIDGQVSDKEGNTLGKDLEYTFETKSLKQDSIVTTVMMVVMCIAIIVLTVRDQAKKQREAEEAENKSNGGKKKPEKVNPYKDAKKEAEKIRARKKKEKQQKVQEVMEKNKNKAKSKAEDSKKSNKNK